MSTHDIIIIERFFIVISSVYRLNCFSSYEITKNIHIFFFCQSMLLFNITIVMEYFGHMHDHTLVTGLPQIDRNEFIPL